MVRLVALSVADAPELWAQLGFNVVGDSVQIGPTMIRCAGLADEHRGILGWTLSADASVEFCVDGLTTSLADPGENAAPNAQTEGSPHPNGVTGIDHLVVMTPDIERTIGEMENAGLPLRRRRDGRAYGNQAMKQAFFWLGDPDDPNDRVILEVVGPAEADLEKSHEGAKFFGLALVSDDLEKTAEFYGDLMKPPTAAVQADRQIATLSSRAGATVALAYMSPHV